MPNDGDFAIVLPGSMIEKIVGEYFNHNMFQHEVRIIESKPTETGYLFTLSFSQDSGVIVHVRGKKGRFIKKGEQQ